MNTGKYKVMVGSSDGKMIVNSVKWPCGVCGKGVHANSVHCTLCIKWIHKRCSGVHGDLSMVADGFRCKRCDGTIQEADLACYLGDTLEGYGGTYLSTTARIRNGWTKSFCHF